MSDEERVLATNIYRTLRESVDYAQSHTVAETLQFVVEQLNAFEGLEVEYYEIVNGETLQPVTSWEDAPHIQGCITVFCGARPRTSYRQHCLPLNRAYDSLPYATVRSQYTTAQG